MAWSPRSTGFRALPAAAIAVAASANAQEMEPRAYVPAPIGVNFAQLAFVHTSGGIAVDPSLPLDNVEARLNAATLGYLRTFSMFGHAASVGGGLPYVWGNVEGDVFEARRSVPRSGIGDVRARLAVNLFGGPALDRKQFASRKPAPALGASLSVVAPTGEYDPSHLINIGSNRWAVKPEIGYYQPLGAWSFELAGGVWFFQDNDDFFGGKHREQEPMQSAQAHLSYTFRRNLWAAADLTYYWGGQTTVNGQQHADLQRSTRAGLTLSVPIASNYSIKMVWSNGVTTRIGADFTTYGITLQRAW